MANHVNRNNFDENAEDIHNDVSQLADTLEEVLKSWGSDAKEEAEAARVKAQSLLKETRARLTQQQKMSDCSKAATAKSLKGDERSTFMSSCLKKA